MRKISAHLILDGLGRCYSKGILTIDIDGKILDILDTHGNLDESAGVEFYSGMIVPGFVNAHCHLELSHLQNVFEEGSGFVPFLEKVIKSRHIDSEAISQAAEIADLLMHKNGIVAVGDIANGTTAFQVKAASKIDYLTFIETLGFAPSRAGKAFEWAKTCLAEAEKSGLKAGISPHAPYSISKQLFEAISAEAVRTGSVLSIHSQESEEEDELFRTASGGMIRHLRDNLSIDTSFFSPSGESALRSTLELLPAQNNLLLVHNLYTKQSDIDYVKSIRKFDNTWFVLCPGSNRYIQNRIPDFTLFSDNQLQICLGTDSLVSNHQLSILEEMKIIQNALPDITLEEMIKWVSFNGANALKISDWAGSIEVGKHPGLNLLTGLDLVGRKLLPCTIVRKLC